MVKVATINAWQMKSDILSKHNDIRLDALVDVIQEGKFNLIAFQEIWEEKAKDVLTQIFAKDYSFVYPTKYNNEFGNGLLVMTDKNLFSFSSVQRISYKEFTPISGIVKGAYNIKLNNHDGSKINFINTHKAFNSWSIPWHYIGSLTKNKKFDSKRDKLSNEQIAQQIILESFVDYENPIIIAGDFNTYGNFNDVVPTGFEIVSPVNESTRSPNNPYAKARFNIPFKDPYICDLKITNIEIFKVKEKGIIKDPLVSDHYPVYADLESLI